MLLSLDYFIQVNHGTFLQVTTLCYMREGRDNVFTSRGNEEVAEILLCTHFDLYVISSLLKEIFLHMKMRSGMGQLFSI